jgi:hypothetical protein
VSAESKARWAEQTGGAAPAGPGVSNLTPFVHVADVEISVGFYRLLGFTVNDTFAPRGSLAWAYLESERAQLMLARAHERISPDKQAVLFYLYAHDLAGLRRFLIDHGVKAGEIVDGSPGPCEEMRVVDPDGYVLMIAQIDEHTG